MSISDTIPSAEDFHTEFKRDVRSGDLERKVVAFLNSPDGGRIFIGVADDGTCIGVKDFDAAQCQIKDRIRDNICPSCLGLFDVRLITAERVSDPIIRVDVAHGLEGPYYLRKNGRSPAGCFVRIGSAGKSYMECAMQSTGLNVTLFVVQEIPTWQPDQLLQLTPLL